MKLNIKDFDEKNTNKNQALDTGAGFAIIKVFNHTAFLR
jgi:hypothetical protein